MLKNIKWIKRGFYKKSKTSLTLIYGFDPVMFTCCSLRVFTDTVILISHYWLRPMKQRPRLQPEAMTHKAKAKTNTCMKHPRFPSLAAL